MILKYFDDVLNKLQMNPLTLILTLKLWRREVKIKILPYET